MAGFSDTPDSYDRVDWDLLQNGPVNLYWRPEILNDDSRWLAQHGYTVHTFDASRWNTEVEMHLDIQPALGFPEYYGNNLNALNDCLSDVAIAEDVGLAVHGPEQADQRDVDADEDRGQEGDVTGQQPEPAIDVADEGLHEPVDDIEVAHEVALPAGGSAVRA